MLLTTMPKTSSTWRYVVFWVPSVYEKQNSNDKTKQVMRRQWCMGGSLENIVIFKPFYFLFTKNAQHEPLLHKFREFKHFMKRMKKAMGKRDEDTKQRLEESKPVYTVDHLVKERYPAFVDALRDLDDVLCMVFLFRYGFRIMWSISVFCRLHSRVHWIYMAEPLFFLLLHLHRIMPRTTKVKEDVVTACDKLAREFMKYIIITGSLRKVFLSIKGIYYQVCLILRREAKPQDHGNISFFYWPIASFLLLWYVFRPLCPRLKSWDRPLPGLHLIHSTKKFPVMLTFGSCWLS